MHSQLQRMSQKHDSHAPCKFPANFFSLLPTSSIALESLTKIPTFILFYLINYFVSTEMKLNSVKFHSIHSNDGSLIKYSSFLFHFRKHLNLFNVLNEKSNETEERAWNQGRIY